MTEKVQLWKGLVGSRLYGYHREDSDYDVRAIYTLPKVDLLDPFRNERQITNQKNGEDDVAYELAFFFMLASQCNPNILEILFVPETHMYYCHPVFQELVINNAHMFLSRELFFRFTGYMRAQLHRLHNHRAWFKNPPKAHPERADYFVPEYLTNEHLTQIVNFPAEVLAHDHREHLPNWREYLEAKKRYQTYQVWVNERSPKRAELEKTYGYDTKFASHAVRLAYETKELLTTGKIVFPLANAEELLAIKNGAWDIEKVLSFADTSYENLEKVMQESKLPRHADRKALKELYFQVLDKVL